MFNRNTVKVSYSCMENVNQINKRHKNESPNQTKDPHHHVTAESKTIAQ